MADLSATSLWDDVARDITRRIRDLDLIPYELARAVAETAAHDVLGDVERMIEVAEANSPDSGSAES